MIEGWKILKLVDMIYVRKERLSMLVGSSVHSQHKRLWILDVFQTVIQVFLQIVGRHRRKPALEPLLCDAEY